MALHSVSTNGRKQNEREAQRFHFYNEIKLFQYLEWYVFMRIAGRLLMVLILSFKVSYKHLFWNSSTIPGNLLFWIFLLFTYNRMWGIKNGLGDKVNSSA